MKVIEAQNLRKSYGENTVIEDLSFFVEKGERIALTAPSGCGKTTLFRLISGLEKPDSGSVFRNGEIAYIFQEPRLFPGFTAIENVAAALEGRERDRKEKAALWLKKVGMGEALDKYPDELSGGMAQRVVLARALATERPILLLDEPFKGLEEESKEKLIDLVKETTQGKTLLLVTHDEKEASALCKKILRFTKGMKIQE